MQYQAYPYNGQQLEYLFSLKSRSNSSFFFVCVLCQELLVIMYTNPAVVSTRNLVSTTMFQKENIFPTLIYPFFAPNWWGTLGCSCSLVIERHIQKIYLEAD